MPRKTETFEIGDCRYEITQLGAIEARRVLARLSSAAALAGPKLLAMSEADMDFFCDTFAKHTLVIGEGVLSKCFNEHFAGRMKHMAEWLEKCIEFNFADFLGEKPPQADQAAPEQ